MLTHVFDQTIDSKTRALRLSNLCQNVRDVSSIQSTMKSLFLEKSDDMERDDLLAKAPRVAMILFIEATYERDFNTLKSLLPHLFRMKINLFDEYRDAMSHYYIINRGRINGAGEDINKCQKDLINQPGYTNNDAWLLVMLALLKPRADILPISKGWYARRELAFDYKSQGDIDTFNTCMAEEAFALKHVSLLADAYNSKNDDIQTALLAAQKKYGADKESMEYQNLGYNIVNVFAWLPLVLTNIKRLCFGESMRLFHYVGTEYSKKISKSIIETIGSDNESTVLFTAVQKRNK